MKVHTPSMILQNSEDPVPYVLGRTHNCISEWLKICHEDILQPPNVEIPNTLQLQANRSSGVDKLTMAIVTVTSSTSTTLFPTATSAGSITHHQSLHLNTKLPFTKSTSKSIRPITRLHVSSTPSTTTSSKKATEETIFFDGGAHYGDLIANLLLGFTLLWLPLTLAAVLRAFYLRYRFTNLRVSVISGLTGQDRSDFSYEVIKDVQVVPRFIGEWGDIIITLKDGTKVDLRSVPKFREIAKYCLSMAEKPAVLKETGPKGF
ncbi:unnamed protein product [Fraxinus pennsylvanica]|uniref:YdbS-like PH domain-containing protein n=1 Tax=Fraxinus pennsylvanica TaxID=56036 RepID=A0AAD2A5G5_9LAMI|nr:unnamed protein product [Fraxinus pennsylvanica]